MLCLPLLYYLIDIFLNFSNIRNKYCDILALAFDPAQSTITGVTSGDSLVINQTYTIIVQAKDSGGNNIATGGEDIYARITDPCTRGANMACVTSAFTQSAVNGGEKVIKLVDLANGSYSIGFNLNHIGDATISVVRPEHQDISADYYSSGSISGPPDDSNTTADINLSWGNGQDITPGNHDNVAAQLTGKLTSFQSGTCSLSLLQDDGADFKINGVAEISNYGVQMFGTTSFNYVFNAFETYDLEIDWIDIQYGAALSLSWDCGSGSILIPPENYATASDVGISPLQVSAVCPDKYEQTPSTTDQCRPVCGDGYVISPEICDDNNTVSGDGCSSDCTSVESRWICLGGSITTKSVCTECPQGYHQNNPSNPTSCVTQCGDGYQVGTEVCDDGNNVDGDGCKSDCSAIETSWACSGGSSAAKSVCTECTQGLYQNDPSNPTECISKCGDGYRLGSEVCDDGNIIDDDGCSYDCTEIEVGWKCDTSVPNICTRDYKSVPMNSNERSIQVATLCAIPTLVLMNVIGGSFSSASTNSILSSINQLQLLILFLLCETFIPLRVVTYLRTLTASLIDIDIDWSFIIVFRKITEWFDFAQPRDDFDTIEISSGSALINLNTLVCMFIIYVIIHFILWVAKKCVGKSKKLCARFIKKAYRSFTFQMYVVLIFEGFINLCLCSFSELERYNVNTNGTEHNSFYFAVFFALICSVSIFTVLVVWISIKPSSSNMKKCLQRELYDGIKLNRCARLQPILFLVRRVVLCFMITFGRSLDRLMFMGLYTLTNLIHCGLICCIRPFKNASENITEIGNEMFIVTFCLFLLLNRSENDWSSGKATIFYWIFILNNVLYAVFSIMMFIYTLCVCKKKKRKDLDMKIMKISPKKTKKITLNVSRCLPRSKNLSDLRRYKYRDEFNGAGRLNSSGPGPSCLNLNRDINIVHSNCGRINRFRIQKSIPYQISLLSQTFW
ncbi:unnamed protein product [Moneuplotes crassus]|uniref:PA14 domain-containing protein n=1 Tax=Euplotes crassus TaxID=5936 RepID=A0AAD1UNT6_EUPCR|nr:unnamed protein product [Moneuplotes crassus]